MPEPPEEQTAEEQNKKVLWSLWHNSHTKLGYLPSSAHYKQQQQISGSLTISMYHLVTHGFLTPSFCFLSHPCFFFDRKEGLLISVASWRWVISSWKSTASHWEVGNTKMQPDSLLRPSRPKRGTMLTSWWFNQGPSRRTSLFIQLGLRLFCTSWRSPYNCYLILSCILGPHLISGCW